MPSQAWLFSGVIYSANHGYNHLQMVAIIERNYLI